MNRRFIVVLILMLALVVPMGRAEAVPDYVRLHVVAADDTGWGQGLKLAVRDAVLERARALLFGVDSAEEAWRVVCRSSEALEDAARDKAREWGYSGSVRCETGVYAFPDRAYNGVVVPAGDYRALRVVIGEGQGRNWWCVLYPSLCWPGADPDAKPYSALWNWIMGLMGGEAS